MRTFYRIIAFDWPPYFFGQIYPKNYPDGFGDRGQRYIGEIRGWSDFSIQSEINSLASSAEISFNPQYTDVEKSFIYYLLTDRDDDTTSKYITNADTDGAEIALRILEKQILTNVDTHKFLESPLDFGSFLQIEAYVFSNKRFQDRRILFHGMIVDWTSDSADKSIKFNLMGLGALAGERPAQLNFAGIDAKTIHPLNVDSDNPQVIEKDAFRHFDKQIFMFVECFRVLQWMFHINPFVRSGKTLFATGGIPEDFRNIKVSIAMQDDTTEDIVEECVDYFPGDWFFRLEYDYSEKDTSVVGFGPYQPQVEVLKASSKKVSISPLYPQFQGYELIPEYYLTNNREIQNVNISFSGSDSFQRLILGSATKGERHITELPDPAAGVPNSIPYIKLEEIKDEDGEGTGEFQPASDSYQPRVLYDTFAKLENTDDIRLAVSIGVFGPPSFQDKADKSSRLGLHRVKVESQKKSKAASTDEGDTGNYFNRTNQLQIMRELALTKLGKIKDPKYSGDITVVATEDRPLEDYKVGQVIGLKGFGNFQDKIVGQISAISRTRLEATLSINTILATSDRRLKALEDDLRNN